MVTPGLKWIGLAVAALAVAALAVSGCAYVSAPVSSSTERRLLSHKLTDAEFGGVTTDGGKSMRFAVFEGSIPVEPVTVPMVEAYHELPGLEMRLNGKQTVKMLADTGAQLCILDAASVLDGGGRTYVPGHISVSVTGIGGNEEAWLARFDHASIGDIELKSFTTLVRRQKTLVRFGPVPMRTMPINLLGCPVFLAFDHVTFDYPRHQFVFSGHTPFTPPKGAQRIPLTARGQLLYVPLRIGSKTVEAMVDTGAKDQIFLNSKTVRKLGLHGSVASGGHYRAIGLGGETAGRQFSVPLVFLGDMPIRNVTVDTAESEAWQARIGSELLSRWKVTFDFRGDAMWVEAGK